MKILFNLYKKLILALGRINTFIILTIVYFAFIPIFYIIIFLQKKNKPIKSSAWLKKESTPSKSYEYQF